MKFLLWLLCQISQGILSVTPSVMFSGHRVVRELTVGRRIGFYKIRGEIGCGNFSHVKLGIHALTKGRKPMKSLKLLKHTCTRVEGEHQWRSGKYTDCKDIS